MQKIIVIIYYWTTDVAILSASVHLDISQQTLVDWYNFLREVCSKHLLLVDCRLGGPGFIVTVDESVITKRKYNRGRYIPEKGYLECTTQIQNWVCFGLFLIENGKLYYHIYRDLYDRERQ